MLKDILTYVFGFVMGYSACSIADYIQRRRERRAKVWHNGRPCQRPQWHTRRSSDADHDRGINVL